MYERVLRPSIPDCYQTVATEIHENGKGDYLSPEFLRCIRTKVLLILRSLDDFPEETIAWTDVDIRFVDLTAERLLRDFDASGAHIAFQMESPRMQSVNTGFFVCRALPSVRNFFERVHCELVADISMNEQMAANKLLMHPEETADIHWAFLPSFYYARTHGWPPPRNLAIYHANYTKGNDAIGQKFAQFAELEMVLRGGFLTWLYSIVRRVPRKILGRER